MFGIIITYPFATIKKALTSKGCRPVTNLSGTSSVDYSSIRNLPLLFESEMFFLHCKAILVKLNTFYLTHGHHRY